MGVLPLTYAAAAALAFDRRAKQFPRHATKLAGDNLREGIDDEPPFKKDVRRKLLAEIVDQAIVEAHHLQIDVSSGNRIGIGPGLSE